MTDYLGLLRTARRTDADCVKSGICVECPSDGEPDCVQSGESVKSPEVDERPALQWVRVDGRTPVEASVPPADWDGTIPANCGVPHVCAVLGPGPHCSPAACCPGLARGDRTEGAA